jgi:ankyrin repeat protein
VNRLRMSVLLAVSVCISAYAQQDYERLNSAIRGGDIAALKTLLDRGVSPNTPDDRQITPLMYAAATGSAEAMKILIDRGAEVNRQNAFGSTALMWSAGDVQKIRLLMHHGADVNKVSKSGRTALMLAARIPDSAPAVHMLLAKGAAVEPKDNQGATALVEAIAGNDTESIRMLIEAGADIRQAGGFLGFSPLSGAAAAGNAAIVRLLLQKGAKVDETMTAPESVLTVKNGKIAFGHITPLAMASTYGPPEVVKTLIEAGADVNAQDVRGMTPLMLAFSTDRFNPAIVRMLLAHGADPSRKSTAGESALDWAHKMGANGFSESLTARDVTAPRAEQTAMPDLRSAVERGVQILEKGSANFFVKGGCVACHAQIPAHIAVSAARTRGVAVDEKAAAERLQQLTVGLTAAGPAILDRQGFVGGDGALYFFEALARGGFAPNRGTDFMVAELATEQWPDGRWSEGGVARTPLSDSPFSRTSMAIRALKTYATPGRAAETKERIERAAQWLLHAEPLTTEDFDMRLSGVAAAGGSHTELEKLAEPILARQRPDGGWGQREELPADAYATGMALSALTESGVLKPDDTAYQRGVKFLLSTQNPDGSWHVVSRAAKLQPYFESGFPWGHDQWISMMGTGWATGALALALDAPKRDSH